MTPRQARASRFDDASVTVRRPTPRETRWKSAEQRSHEQALLIDPDDSGHPNDALVVLEVEAGGWRATWTVAEQLGGYVARSLHLEPIGATTPASGITTNLLRELSPRRYLGALNTEAGTEVLDWLDAIAGEAPAPTSTSEALADQYRGDLQRGGPDWLQPPAPQPQPEIRRGGRPRVPDHELAQVSEAYLEELRTGQSGVTTRIRKRLAKEFGYRQDTTVRDRIRMCRDRGWLTRGEAQQGKSGATPGPRLLAWRQTGAQR